MCFLMKGIHMSLFINHNNTLKLATLINLVQNKELQNLIENNLKSLFNFSIIASNFLIDLGDDDRIDTLALSEDNKLIMINYSVLKSSSIISQSMYNHSCLENNKEQILLTLNKDNSDEFSNIDLTDIRVITITPDYNKSDLFMVKKKEFDMELWKYKYYDDGSLFLGNVYEGFITSPKEFVDNNSKIETLVLKNKNMQIKIDEQEPLKRPSNKIFIKNHLIKKIEIKNERNLLLEILLCKADAKRILLINNLRSFIMGLGVFVEEIPTKKCLAYKISKRFDDKELVINFVEMEIHKEFLNLFLKINPNWLKDMPSICSNLSESSFCDQGNLEITVTSVKDLNVAKEYLTKSYSFVNR